jgi:hypothetical protein
MGRKMAFYKFVSEPEGHVEPPRVEDGRTPMELWSDDLLGDGWDKLVEQKVSCASEG